MALIVKILDIISYLAYLVVSFGLYHVMVEEMKILHYKKVDLEKAKGALFVSFLFIGCLWGAIRHLGFWVLG